MQEFLKIFCSLLLYWIKNFYSEVSLYDHSNKTGKLWKKKDFFFLVFVYHFYIYYYLSLNTVDENHVFIIYKISCQNSHCMI